jgi:hypothetical protein
MQAGRDIASNITNQINALAQYQGDQGVTMADLIGQQAGILAGIQGGTGAGISDLSGNIANQLAGIAQGTGTAYNPAALGGLQQIEGILGQSGQRGLSGAIAGGLGGGGGAAGGAQAAILSSDARLKENIQKIGTTPSGHNWYTWDWNEEGKAITNGQPSYGVIAQEVAQVDPSAVIVGDDGYLRVDYSKV